MPKFHFDVECDQQLVERINSDFPDVGLANEYATGLLDVLAYGREPKQWRVSTTQGGAEENEALATDPTDVPD